MQTLFVLAMVPLPLLLRGRGFSAWLIVLASFFAGIVAHKYLPEQHTLLLAYALIDCAAGLLVQASRTWQAKGLGCAYGVMILSHFSLHAGFINSVQHGFIGGTAGVALVLLLWIWGFTNGGSSHSDSVRLSVEGISNSGEKG